MNVVIRVDASRTLGIGHAMRCLALAERLRGEGATVAFVCGSPEDDLSHVLERDPGFVVQRLAPADRAHAPAPAAARRADPSDAPWRADALATARVLRAAERPVDWLVVDHYGLAEGWESALRPYVGRILVIDDLADRPHDCDLLLDQGLSTDRARYEPLVPAHCRLLLGPAYALLRADFLTARAARGPRDGGVERVLVAFGGSDPTGQTSKALDALDAPEFAHLSVDVVVGAGHQDVEGLAARLAERPNTTLHVQTDAMACLMAEADLAIGAAGMSALERCCVGLPAVVLTIADNQVPIALDLADLGAISYLGDQDDVGSGTLYAALRGLLPDAAKLAAQSAAGLALVDGRGTARVARLMGGYAITLVSDAGSWIAPYLVELARTWSDAGHVVTWCNAPDRVPAGDFAFYLSCSQVASAGALGRNRHNLVVHESALPAGRGWSPLTWQVLEGKTEIPILLFEAVEALDSGPIYLQDVLRFDGYELVDQLRALQGKKTVELCREFVRRFPAILGAARPQRGRPSRYPRRGPADSRLDPDRTLREQFDLLRTVDNTRYPAFFELDGRRFVLRIEASDEA